METGCQELHLGSLNTELTGFSAARITSHTDDITTVQAAVQCVEIFIALVKFQVGHDLQLATIAF